MSLTERAPRAYGHPLAEKMFVADLEKNRPKYFFDLSPVDNYTFTFSQYPWTSYPEISAYINLYYIQDGRIGRVPVYRRRTDLDIDLPETPKDSTSLSPE